MEGVVSLRSRGRSMGEESGKVTTPMEKVLCRTYNAETTVRPDSDVDGSGTLCGLVRCTNYRHRTE